MSLQNLYRSFRRHVFEYLYKDGKTEVLQKEVIIDATCPEPTLQKIYRAPISAKKQDVSNFYSSNREVR